MFPFIEIPQHGIPILNTYPSLHTHIARTTQPTFPPEAQREPSGETVTQFKKPLCPKWLVFNLQFVKFQTYNNKNFTRPSLLFCVYTYLDKLVPATRHYHWVLRVWGKPHTTHPVAMAVIL